jgi:Cu2+-exporting ATPase
MKPKIQKSNFPVLEMSCAACANAVEKAVQAQPGVQEASVNYANHSLQVQFDEKTIQPEALRKAVQAAGYDLIIEETDTKALEAEYQRDKLGKLKAALWGAGLLSVPVIVISMAWPDATWARWAALVLSFPVVFGYGLRFFKTAVKQARMGSANMDTLVALSTGIAWLFSAFNTVFPDFFIRQGLDSHVYFEAAAGIVFFILIGKYLEENARAHTSSALKTLMSQQPDQVWRMESGQPVQRQLNEVLEGDTLLVRPGDQMPVDGSAVEGESLVDESSISGEAILQLKKAGDRVFAGTYNQQGSLYIRAEQVGADTQLAHIIQTVQEAQGSKAPVQRLADKVAAVFVPSVLVAAGITFLIWLLLGQFTIGLLTGITVLVIACPCALGLATPTALIAGIGRAAQMGILIKNAEQLEQARRLTDIVLDKTGTLTASRPSVEAQWWSPGREHWHPHILKALEQRSNHPLAAAVSEALQHPGKDYDISNLRQISGKGVEGTVEHRIYRAGSPDWLREHNVVFEPEAQDFIQQQVSDGAGIVCFSENEQLIAVMGLIAPLKPEAQSAVDQLKAMGLTLHILSGDQPKAVEHIAQTCGIENFEGGVLPHDKAAYVKKLKDQGRSVGMVGDGVNDAEAMALADVGIAMGHGADVAIEVADMTLLGSDLSKLPLALRLSGRTVTTIRQNLFWAFVYNLIGIPIAAGLLYPVSGFLLNPMMAGAAMAFSSVSVVGNSLRLRNASIK